MLDVTGLVCMLLAGFGVFGSLSPGLELRWVEFLLFWVSPARMVKGWGLSCHCVLGTAPAVPCPGCGTHGTPLREMGSQAMGPIPQQSFGAVVPAHFSSLLGTARAAAAYASAGSLV